MTSRLIASLLALVVACNATDTAETSITIDPTTTTTPPATTTVPETTAPESGPPQILVSSELGVSLVEGDQVIPLVDTPAWVAMDDLEGGIVYQSFHGEAIWWLRSGSPVAVDLDVAGGRRVSLEDVAIGPGGPELWFTRWDTETADDAVQYLLRLDLSSAATESLGQVGGWESSTRVTVGGDLVVGEWWAEAWHGFAFRDRGYDHWDSLANPYGPDGELDCGPCPQSVELSTAGDAVAWIEGRPESDWYVTTLVVKDTASGAEIAALALPEGTGIIEALDLHEGKALLSRRGATVEWLPPYLIDLTNGETTELPIAGNARFAQSPPILTGGKQPTASEEFPPQRLMLAHGGDTWAVVLAASDDWEDPVLADAVANAEAAGYTTGPTDCDAGAAEALGLSTDHHYYTVSVYLLSEPDAEAARHAFAARSVEGTVALIQTYCLD